MEPPAKRARLLSDDSGSEADDSAVEDAALKINREFADRFQHNQQRAERQRLEEKYGSGSASASDSDDSDSQSEDDEGELVTKELDDEISATLNAIRNKDPRVYDKQVSFYATEAEPTSQQNLETSFGCKDKPVHLRDYHRKNLLEDAGELKPDPSAPPTYAEEQSALKRDLLNQMHSMPGDDPANAAEEEEEEFLIRKPGKPLKSAKAGLVSQVDVDMADKDPETYLSNFMASRAWVPSAGSRFQPFESEDEDEEERADAFELAYNMRFENPEHANEKLVSHSRDFAVKQSVRRDEPKGRKKAREDAKSQRDAEKLQREEEKARLRRLKIDEAHEKWMRLKEAAGLKQQHLSDEKLVKFLEQGFEDQNWDQDMAKLLGEAYYNEGEDEDEDESLNGNDSEQGDDSKKGSKKRSRKPKWDDDIDIGDIVPDFNEEEERQAGIFTLSDDEIGKDDNSAEDDQDPTTISKVKVKAKDAKKSRANAKRESRLARQKIEALVDTQLATTLDAPENSTGVFRYRETSPTTLGLSARDILMASDSQLNQFAGLKKLATYRDEGKKASDRKKLGKKARLRQWRKETFGDERGEESKSFEDFVNESRETQPAGLVDRRVRRDDEQADEADIVGATGEKRKKKRKRSKKTKTADLSGQA